MRTLRLQRDRRLYEDNDHQARLFEGGDFSRIDTHLFAHDWLRDALNGDRGVDKDALRWWEA